MAASSIDERQSGSSKSCFRSGRLHGFVCVRILEHMRRKMPRRAAAPALRADVESPESELRVDIAANLSMQYSRALRSRPGGSGRNVASAIRRWGAWESLVWGNRLQLNVRFKKSSTTLRVACSTNESHQATTVRTRGFSMPPAPSSPGQSRQPFKTVRALGRRLPPKWRDTSIQVWRNSRI